MLVDTDAACVATVLLLRLEKRKWIAAGRRVQTKSTVHKNLSETYGWASQTTTAFFCDWFIRHLMNCSSMLSVCKRSSHSQAAFFFFSTTLRCLALGNTFEDPKFSFWTCLQLGIQTVTELMCAGLSTDCSVFSMLYSTTELFWLTQYRLQPLSGNTRRSAVVWYVYCCPVLYWPSVCRNSAVGIATRGLDGPGIKSRWRRDIPHTPRPP